MCLLNDKMLPLYNSPFLASGGEHRKRHTMRAHKPQIVSDMSNPLSVETVPACAYSEFNLKFNLFDQLPGTH